MSCLAENARFTLDLLRAAELTWITRPELQRVGYMSKQEARECLRYLVQQGLLRKVGEMKSTRYFLVDD